MLVDNGANQNFAGVSGGIKVDWGAQDEYDTGSFTWASGANEDEITLDNTGFYQISYSFNADSDNNLEGKRAATIARLQLDPLGANSWSVDLEYGHGYAYNRNADSGNVRIRGEIGRYSL